MDGSMTFDFNDIVLVPAAMSDIASRSEVNIYDNKGRLPLMVSPMDTVVDETSSGLFYSANFTVCVPRGLTTLANYNANMFAAVSLDEFEEYVNSGFQGKLRNYWRILIDVANGHMRKLYNLVQRYIDRPGIKQEIMVGNIANPETYRLFAELGVDYIRCGIGGGSACLTSANTGVHYPMASLIQECYEIFF